MAIRITEDGVVNYENSPDINRKLFPNLNPCRSEIDELTEEINGKAPVILNTASGSIASFSDGADGMPLKSCIVTFEPIQEGEGNPSPENVRPISGLTGLEVYHSGADTSDPVTISVNWETEAGTVYGGTFDVVNGKLTIEWIKGTELTNYSGNLTDLGSTLRTGIVYFGTSSFPTVLPSVNGNAYSNILPVRSSGYNSDRPGFYFYNPTGGYLFFPKASLSTPDVDGVNALLAQTPFYVVYRLATPIEIQLSPQEIRTLLGENNIWSDAGSVAVEYPADTKMYVDESGTVKDVQVDGTSVVTDGVANVPIAGYYPKRGVITVYKGYGISIRTSGDYEGMIQVDFADELYIKKGSMSSYALNSAQTKLVAFYGLAQAAGDTTQSTSSNAVGTYTEDAKSAIQAMLGISSIVGTVEGATASTSYSIGDVFLHSGALYKATAAIASGDAIVPGTNCEQTTIIDILKGA